MSVVRVLLCLMVPAQIISMPAARAETPLERGVLAILNRMRADPADYARSLQAFRQNYHGKVVLLPGDPVRHLTLEGVKPLDEAVAFLARQQATPVLTRDDQLYASAAGHVAEQARTGAVGHYSRDGATPPDRIRAHGGGGMVAEVITYGALDAADVIRQLMIDDGVVDRGHRFALFEAGLRFAGIACGRHPRYSTIRVIDFAGEVGAEPGSETAEPVEAEPEIKEAPANPQAIVTPGSP